MSQIEYWFLALYSPTWPPKYLNAAWEADRCVHKVCTKLKQLSWPRVHLCRHTTKSENVVVGKIVKWKSQNKVVVETGQKDLNEAEKTLYQ